MLFIYLYHGDLYSDLWKSDLYFRHTKSRCLVSTSSIKRESRKFHFLVVQRRQRNVQKSVQHVLSCCFAKAWFSYVGKIPDDRGVYCFPTVPDFAD